MKCPKCNEEESVKIIGDSLGMLVFKCEKCGELWHGKL